MKSGGCGRRVRREERERRTGRGQRSCGEGAERRGARRVPWEEKSHSSPHRAETAKAGEAAKWAKSKRVCVCMCVCLCVCSCSAMYDAMCDAMRRRSTT